MADGSPSLSSRRLLPVKREFLLPAVTKYLLKRSDC